MIERKVKRPQFQHFHIVVIGNGQYNYYL